MELLLAEELMRWVKYYTKFITIIGMELVDLTRNTFFFECHLIISCVIRQTTKTFVRIDKGEIQLH